MTANPKRKGDQAEREVAAIIADRTGHVMRRTLAGHAADVGDLHGLPSTTIQVKNYTDIARAISEGLRGSVLQQHTAGADHGALWVRRRGGSYVVILTPDQWLNLWTEATA